MEKLRESSTGGLTTEQKVDMMFDYLMRYAGTDTLTLRKSFETTANLMGSNLTCRNANLGSVDGGNTIKVGNDDATTTVGFFGVTPVVQQAAITNATGGSATVAQDPQARAALNSLLTELRNYGLLKP